MTKREVVRTVLDHRRPPYVPWSFSFTYEAERKLQEHYQTQDLTPHLQNHFLWLADPVGQFTPVREGFVRDYFGVVWNRTKDKDIGIVEDCLLSEPTLRNYTFPNPTPATIFENISKILASGQDGLRIFPIGFSLFERAWTLRGMENLLADFIESPGFVRELLWTIADYNIARIREVTKYDIDAVYFGDDWGQQRGLLMGPRLWREFILPELRRMYAEVRKAGKYVYTHCCGDVDELFEDLIAAGVNCFNPFQPEVMDIESLLPAYRGRLSFHGGMSTQRLLPYGSPEDVRRQTRHLLALGASGGYIFAPAHAVEGDVPLENMLAFIEECRRQCARP